MAAKIRFKYDDLQTYADGVVDSRGRRGLAQVPVHYKIVNLKIYIKTDESDKRLNRLIDLVSRYCPVDSLIKAAVPDYNVTWVRMSEDVPGPTEFA
jgi:uncharacterized OsmC-like protein